MRKDDEAVPVLAANQNRKRLATSAALGLERVV
jgi:hypothetical protein